MDTADGDLRRRAGSGDDHQLRGARRPGRRPHRLCQTEGDIGDAGSQHPSGRRTHPHRRRAVRCGDISTRRVWASWRRVTQREASHPNSAPAAAPVYNPTNAPSLPHTPAATAVPVPPPTSTPVQTGCRLGKERRLGGCDWEARVECLVVSSPASAYRDSAARIGVLCPWRGTPSVVCA